MVSGSTRRWFDRAFSFWLCDAGEVRKVSPFWSYYFFSFWWIPLLWADTFRLHISGFSLKFHSLLWASIYESCPKHLLWCSPKWRFFFFLCFQHSFCIYWYSIVRKTFSYFSTYLFIYFYKQGLIEYYLMDRNLLFLFEAHFVPFSHYPANATATLSSITIAWCGLFLNLTWEELYIYIVFCVSFLLLNLAVHLCWV